MAIPEAQLATWSSQGSVTQSAQTYEAIRTALDDSAAPYHSRDFSIFLQGSYGNDTNIYRDSDVDVVIRLNQTYYADTGQLTPLAKANYDRVFSLATYTYSHFYADVLAWLQARFGAAVRSGKKAIFIKGSGNRRDADVLVCAQHRRYGSSSSGLDSQYHEGIVFWTSNGTEIINFPRQHSENCSNKHQNTTQRFKRMVRVYKNMRNRMIDDHRVADGVAPSYFIEGMLWNVPSSAYVESYQASFINTFNWVLSADRSTLTCANGLHWLVRDDANVCWPLTNCDIYLTAAGKYWNDWTA